MHTTLWGATRLVAAFAIGSVVTTGLSVAAAQPASAHTIKCVNRVYQPRINLIYEGSVSGYGSVECDSVPDVLEIGVCLEFRSTSADEWREVACEYDNDGGSFAAARAHLTCIEGRHRYRTVAISKKVHGNPSTKRKVSEGLTVECRNGRITDTHGDLAGAQSSAWKLPIVDVEVPGTQEAGPQDDYTLLDGLVDASFDNTNTLARAAVRSTGDTATDTDG